MEVRQEKDQMIPVVLKATNVGDRGHYVYEVLGTELPERALGAVYVRLSAEQAQAAVDMFERGPDVSDDDGHPSVMDHEPEPDPEPVLVPGPNPVQ